MRNNLTSQQLHTALSRWFTREVKIPECWSPKPQLKLLLLHQTSPLVTIIITTALGENKACDAQERMETEGHRALKYNSLRKKTHSSWLTILISPLIHQIPHYVELLPGTLTGPPLHTVPQTLGRSQTCSEEEG